MSKNKVVKSVSFNITDEQDQVYLERIQDINFSGYVKKLIEKDIKARKIIKAEPRTEDTVRPPETGTGAIIIRSGGLSLKTV